ncbi:hypothetical protein R5H30_10740 [Sulfitobacter sp. D35]|uniref:hypothetical protein n=1 Tax=Sulfitobacter sp. D35 TaxID=3083252 RepID=UPI00296F13C8|nr:hypothetical protein [Sulfitobacter sp. D35]MDW4498458.1 hypothetical protein [Sulfitobacter sp. D35]
MTNAYVLKAALLAILLSISVSPASAKGFLEIPFDPAACPEDTDGMIFVRLDSGFAFSLPYDRITLSRARVDPVSTSDAQAGCPENPVRARAFGLPFHYLMHLDGRKTEALQKLDVTQLHVAAVSQSESLLEGPYRSFNRDKKTFGNCGTTRQGIEYCWACFVDETRPGHCRTSSPDQPETFRPYSKAFIAAKDAGSLVGMRSLPWATDCLPSGWSDHICSTAYALQDGLTIFYKFEISDGNFDMARQTDLAIRDLVESVRVPHMDGDDVRQPGQ